MLKNSKIYVAGHQGTAGSAILHGLQKQGFKNLVFKTKFELDLTNQAQVNEFFKKEKPEFVILAAARLAHLGQFQPASVLYDNLAIQNNVLKASYENKVKKLLFFGSAWMYPQKAKNPITEEALLTSKLDKTATYYALAKIAGLKLCQAFNQEHKTQFLSLALANLYGETKDFNFKTAKVLPAILRKIHLAKLLSENKQNEILQDILTHDKVKLKSCEEVSKYLANFGISKTCVELWGSGKVKRDFIHAKDLARASIFVMQNINADDLNSLEHAHLNVGSQEALSIKDLAKLIKKIIGFKGSLKFDTSKPDSAMNRVLNCSKITSFGFKPEFNLTKGVTQMYKWYRNSASRGGD